MKRFFALAAFAIGGLTVHAATINYHAFISCSSCVTSTVSWAAQPVPIFFVEVDDSLGNFLFGLNVGVPSTTGSIQPNPQTVFGLPQHTIFVVSNGQAGIQSIASVGPAINVFATLDLFDSEHNLIDTTVFVADPSGVPEPAVWSLMGGGMALLFALSRVRRRKFQS